MVDDFRDVIAIWDTPHELATQVGVRVEAIRKWHQRDRIPPHYWQRIIEAAQAKGQALSADDLTRIANDHS